MVCSIARRVGSAGSQSTCAIKNGKHSAASLSGKERGGFEEEEGSKNEKNDDAVEDNEEEDEEVEEEVEEEEVEEEEEEEGGGGESLVTMREAKRGRSREVKYLRALS